MEKMRSKAFNLVLYEEDPTHANALEQIQVLYDFAFIKHDKDVDSDGNILKPHYHVVLRFKNAKWNTALAEELGIEINYIQKCVSLSKSLLYLVHYYDSDKFQYPLDEVKGSLKVKLKELIQNKDKSENEKAVDIFEYIDNFHGYLDFTLFCKHMASIGYYDVVRRGVSIFREYVTEHNGNFITHRTNNYCYTDEE